MSWFDSSFTFARTALSQAQKSIDKVLDIRDEQAGVEDQAQFGECYELYHILRCTHTNETFCTCTILLKSS